ncbi:glycosyltransferase [Pseudoalteromonas sp. NZS127_1]|uniref:glycosyltransferase n=1 Tax=Pseudoalteromonas sp. NZS127_1 TaxID=2792074 RepID=UPI0018CF2339|nr:glycosyltransferase [Pseudoalteromonas sp. NZS127_1]
MVTIFSISIFILIYIYFLFPLIIYICGALKKDSVKQDVSNTDKTIVIVVPAHNEEAVISKKIENHLALDYEQNNYKILVISDTSSDKTVEITNIYVDQYPERVELFEVNDGLGKTNAINQALVNIDCDILVFSDANVYLKSDALLQISKCYEDKNVGGVAGQLIYTNNDVEGAAQSNGLYWKYEEMIKKSESLSGSMMGADGSIFSIKRRLLRELPVHVLDDFCSSMGVINQGYKLKFDDTITAYEKGAESTAEEFPRKVRISNRSYNSYKHLRAECFKTLSLFDLWKLYSHKVLRWYSLFFMVSALVSNLFIAISEEGYIFTSVLILHVLFYIMAALSWLNKLPNIPVISKLAAIAEYFTMANVAAGIGILQSISGKKTVTWKKADSTR